MIRAVLFDLDGTLLDSTDLLVTGYRHSVRACLGIETAETDWIEHLGKPLRDQMALFSEDRADEMVRTYRAWYADNHDRMIRLYPGVPEALEQLHRAGLKLAVVTSKKTRFACQGLELFGLNRYFSAILGEEDSARHKPHPDPVLDALALLSVPPEAAVMVGDSCLDIESACAAGVFSIGALWGPFARERLTLCPPDMFMEDIKEIIEMLGERPPSRDNPTISNEF
ncbi:MAG: HAD-IA family hydrolase [Armatimonadetes bacterium]|nr:HAD-IA family hydrolase [Armatimonadota bacterium]